MDSIFSLVVFVVVGLIAGWLAGLIWKGRGFGLIGNLIIGIVGSFLGGYLFGLAGITFLGIFGSLIAALAGALLLLFIINLIKRK